MDKKKIKKCISSAVAIVFAITVFGLNVFAANDPGAWFKKSYGYANDYSVKMNTVNTNTEIGHLDKTYPGTYYSMVRLYKTSTVNQMNVWVMTSDKKWMSDKVKIVPNDNDSITIPYAKGVTFVKDAPVHLWGEQGNAKRLVANIRFYAF